MEFLDRLNVGLVTYDTYLQQILSHGDLPTIPRNYFLPIAGYDITDEKLCKAVLDSLKEDNKRIDEKYSKEEQLELFNEAFDTDCFFVQLNAGQVFDFWFGKKKYIENNTLHAYLDCFAFDFWKYLREEITYEKLKESASKLNHAYEELSHGGEQK